MDVPTPELSQNNNHDDDDDMVDDPRQLDVEYDVPVRVPEHVLPHAPLHAHPPVQIPIVHTDEIDWPVQPIQHVVQQLVPVQSVPVDNVVQEVVAEHEQQQEREQEQEHEDFVPQTHAGRATRNMNPE